MSRLWSGQFKSEPISGPWRCLSRHFVFSPPNLSCADYTSLPWEVIICESVRIYFTDNSPRRFWGHLLMKVFWLHYMNCWKVLTTPPYNFHTLSPSNFLMQIKTPFTQQLSKARVHFSFFLQTCFWDNLFVLIYFWRHLICLGKSPLVMLSPTNTLPCVLHCCRSICT